MEKEIIKVTPDQLGYKDRGKMKWQSLMLSDHLDALKEMAKEDAAGEPKQKEWMAENEISEILQLDYVSKKPIVMQTNVLRDGNYFQDLHFMVLGYAGYKIYLRLKDGRRTACELFQIRNVEYMSPLEWFDKH